MLPPARPRNRPLARLPSACQPPHLRNRHATPEHPPTHRQPARLFIACPHFGACLGSSGCIPSGGRTHFSGRAQPPRVDTVQALTDSHRSTKRAQHNRRMRSFTHAYPASMHRLIRSITQKLSHHHRSMRSIAKVCAKACIASRMGQRAACRASRCVQRLCSRKQ